MRGGRTSRTQVRTVVTAIISHVSLYAVLPKSSIHLRIPSEHENRSVLLRDDVIRPHFPLRAPNFSSHDTPPALVRLPRSNKTNRVWGKGDTRDGGSFKGRLSQHAKEPPRLVLHLP